MNKKGFTLIELMVVITIMVIIGVTTYIPYQHYQNKQKVRNSAKIISQTFYESRNLAINGENTASGNLAIGLSFSGGNDFIEVFKYPYTEKINFSGPNFSDYKKTKYFSKKVKLEPFVQITNNNKILFLFNEISGSGIYYDYNSNSEISLNNIEIELGFKGATSGNLIKKVNYYTKTYITDIE